MKRLSRRQFMLATAVSFCCTATGHARWPFFGADDDAPADIRGDGPYKRCTHVAVEMVQGRREKRLSIHRLHLQRTDDVL